MKEETLRSFASTIYKLLKSDRDVNIGVGGFTGEGKSTFSTKLQKEYSRVTGTAWNFNHMTWSRKELLRWIDGEGKEKKGQLPEYTAILPDELFGMFYRRNWFDGRQIDAIATFNMCRDRHLFICGNVPNFWDLDAAFTSRIRFYVYIPWRGTAWVFEQENNPFSVDNWNATENRKVFRKKKNPYSCKNFLCSIEYPDWDIKEKKRYYEIRNEKRLSAVKENQSQRIEKYTDVKRQRDELLRFLLRYNANVVEKVRDLEKEAKKQFIEEGMHKPITNKAISQVMGLSESAIQMLRWGK